MQERIQDGLKRQITVPFNKLIGANEDEESLLDGETEEDNKEKRINIFGTQNHKECSDHHDIVAGVHNNDFNHNFEQKMNQTDDIISMITNLKFANAILLGMTEILNYRV